MMVYDGFSKKCHGIFKKFYLFIYLFIYLFFADLTVLNLFSIFAKFQVFYAGESLMGVVSLLTSVSDYETKIHRWK